MTDSRAMNSAPSITRLVEYEAFPFAIDSVDLTFELDPTRTRVTQSSVVRRIVRGQHALELNGKNLHRISIKIDGAEIETGRLVEIDDINDRNVPDEFHLEIETEINPEANTALEGLYLSRGMFCTQCEAEGFRRITYYPDRPDVMSIFTTRIISDASHLFYYRTAIQSAINCCLTVGARWFGMIHFQNLVIYLRWLVATSRLSTMSS